MRAWGPSAMESSNGTAARLSIALCNLPSLPVPSARISLMKPRKCPSSLMKALVTRWWSATAHGCHCFKASRATPGMSRRQSRCGSRPSHANFLRAKCTVPRAHPCICMSAWWPSPQMSFTPSVGYLKNSVQLPKDMREGPSESPALSGARDLRTSP